MQSTLVYAMKDTLGRGVSFAYLWLILTTRAPSRPRAWLLVAVPIVVSFFRRSPSSLPAPRPIPRSIAPRKRLCWRIRGER